ncbi:hypothetical protein AZF37_02315 [endosymbiont 'TC1' of Trimyema compressum]|uniref:PolC-type DNA polymerase III n=1 Tax=endosymbiont 'TC1' of Trimyema compressum TaxID=243899 RepID=UPI0007F0FB5B|nr:PolC-type DNA polymerase III [endosymbiont 'TC1' of Trimyema compressum]AMP20158.1 hypothetical protein AZF37_02315 [endosymbiont 'TC1' of Trimyema compressum]
MNQKWNDFLDKLNMDSELKEQIRNPLNVEIMVKKESQRFMLIIETEFFLTIEKIQIIEGVLEKAFYPYGAYVFPRNNYVLDAIEKMYPYLSYRISKKALFFKDVPMTFNYKEGILNITLPSSFHVSSFKNRKINTSLFKWFKRMFDREDYLKDIILDSNEKFEDTLVSIEEKEKEAVSKVNEIQLERKEYVKTKEKAIKKTRESHVLFGNSILEEGTYPESLMDPLKNVVYYGIVYQLEERILKNGSLLITFALLGKMTGIYCKMFLKKNEDRPNLKNGQFLKIKGNGQIDLYKKDITLTVKDINIYFPEIISDKAPAKRVELHLHTKMSALDATLDIHDLFKRMKEYGHNTVAITDHGVVQIFPEAYTLGKKENIKVLFGIEGYLYDDSDKENLKKSAYHIVLIVKNMIGLKHLYELVTESHLNNFYRRPKIPMSKLKDLREGLILGSACEAGELYRAIVEGKPKERIKEIASFYDYLEIQPISNNLYMVRNGLVENEEVIRNYNREIVALGEELNKPVVATGDVHFLEKEDQLYRAVLMKSKGFRDVSQPALYYRTTEEMLKEFDYLGAEKAYKVVIENTNKVAGWIEEEITPVPKEFFPPEIDGAENQVKEITLDMAHEIYGNPLPEIVEKRLDKELKSIISNGFSVLYLIAHKLVKKSNEDGYIVGSRGSVGSSLVATMMGITEVNPLVPHYLCSYCKTSEFIEDGSYSCGADMPDKNCPHCGEKYIKDGFHIPFETFLGFDGDKVPDIDLNFSGEYQPIIHRYTEEIFGKGNVFKAGTIGTVADKTAYGFVRKYYEEENLILPKEVAINAIASGCVGVKRTTGQHPGGIMVVPKSTDIHYFTPLQRPADDTKSDIITTHFDYHSIGDQLVKLDLLGHDDPTIIKYLEEITGVDVKHIPLDQQDVMSLFLSADALNLEEPFVDVGSLGLPEFGTSFVRQMLKDTKPSMFSDLLRISGFSHGTDVWLNNAKDLIVSGRVKLSEAISTRDDIMVYLMQKGLEASMAFKIMEFVRKGRGLTDEFRAVMIENNVPEWYIASCEKISYMFPKAHATAYVMMAFRLGYFKIFHKEAFYASYFSIRGENFDFNLFKDKKSVKDGLDQLSGIKMMTARDKEIKSLLEIAYEMYLRGISVLNIDLNQSDAARFKVVEGNLLPPFLAIPGLGVKAAETVVTERNKSPFLSIDDVRRRGKLNNKIIEEMKELKILDDLPESEQLLLF